MSAEQKQASGIIVSAISDHALYVVSSGFGKPMKLLENLEACYDSKWTAFKITKMSDLVTARYTDPKAELAKQIDGLAALLKQLRSMDAKMDDSLAVEIFVKSIDMPDLKAVVAASKTLADADATWETVTERLIEE